MDNYFNPGDAAPKLLSPEEQRLIAQSNHDLDARYSEEAITARLRALEDEAGELKRLRDGDL
jgi:hypothetical protein